jgi:hypothetical protein
MSYEPDLVLVKINKLSPNKVTYTIDLTKDLQRYFIKKLFSLSYNIPISKKTELLLIPAVSIILPLSLIKKKRIKVSLLDRNFYLNMLRLGELLYGMYPLIPNEVKLQPEESRIRKSGGRM